MNLRNNFTVKHPAIYEKQSKLHLRTPHLKHICAKIISYMKHYNYVFFADIFLENNTQDSTQN